MKTQLRLNSTVIHGVGSGPESGAIDLIYGFLLAEFEQNIYSFISINQIGSELEEFVSKEDGNKIYVNIRYPVFEDFETKNTNEKNLIRLDVIHTALLRVASQFGKLQIHKLEQIKEKIIKNNFRFDFECKIYRYKKNENVIAKIVVCPELDRFNYYCVVEDNQKVKCKIKLYSGLTNLFYYSDLFSSVKWKSMDVLAINGKAKEVEINIIVSKCEITFTNLTKYTKPPYFEMMRADTSEADRQKAYQDWLHSLPLSHSSIITHEPN